MELLQKYKTMACGADAIVLGHTDVWMHHLSSSRTQIYTDYDLAVDKIIKNNQGSAISTTKHIVVTRPGGSLPLGTGTLKIVDVQPGGYPHLQVNTAYLIFLHYIPECSGYEALGSLATFVASYSQWTIASKAFANFTLPDFTKGILETSIASWLSSCRQ